MVADSLSRDALYLSSSTHISFLQKCASKQLPENFRIVPVPEKINSFVSSVLQLLPKKQQRLIAPKPSELLHSNIGCLSSMTLNSPLHSWITSQDSKNTSHCLPLPKQSEKLLTLQEIKSIWWKEQSTPPSHMWLRPSGQTTGETQDWTLMERSALSSKNNSGVTEIKMVPEENRKHFQCQY